MIILNFSHLHTHSCGSRRDAHSRVDKLVERASSLNQRAIALTDHGVLHMIPELFKEAGKHGIKPVAGNEMYFCPEGRHTKEKHYHQLVLVKNATGWHNLLKLTAESYLTGFHGKPRIDWELLNQHQEGLVFTSSCLAGMIPQAIMKGEYKEARKLALRWSNSVDDFYLELQPTNTPQQEMVNKELKKIADELDIPCIVTGDVHYVAPEDMTAHLGMLCLGRNQKMQDISGYDGEENYYLKSAKDIYSGMRLQGFEQDFIVEAMNNTGKIVDEIDFELTKEKDHLPAFPSDDGTPPDELIGKMVKDGLMRKIGTVTKEHVERIKYELEVIRGKGYSDYFLIVADAIKKAKELGIMLSPARGSGAGSLVSFLLDITEVDPIRHKLFFERFLDVTRLKMPDIDSDIEDERRYELIDYLVQKYGFERIAQIANKVFMTTKSAFKNAFQVYDIPFKDSQAITNLIPDKAGSIAEAYKIAPEFAKMRKKKAKTNPDKDGKTHEVALEDVFQMAEKFEGVLSSLSKHAGGILITPSAISDYFPIHKSPSDPFQIVQWDKDQVEQYGGIKFDFLGLSTLRTIGLCLRSIEAETGTKIDVNSIYRGELDDPLVYEKITKGETANSFQLNSQGMQDLCKAVKPTQFEHIVAINALYRPPALKSGDTWRYARIKNGQEDIHYSHPDEEAITGDTYGVITYQEHVMQLVHHFAGWDYGRGDKLRKASEEDLEGMREEFIEDALTQYDFSPDNTEFVKQMDELWTRIVNYMGYGFNKSHGVAYSMISYLTVYLEAHYPEHWKSAIMTTKMGEQEKIAQVFTEIKREGFEFQAPSINKSDLVFTAHSGKIVFPLGTIKGVGEVAVQQILERRPFTSFEDLMERTEKRVVSARAVKPLILAGAFDELYPDLDRRGILLEYYRVKKETKKKIAELEEMPWDENIQAEHEKDLLGIYITYHPMDKYNFRRWAEIPEGAKEAVIGGSVSSVKTIQARNGRMAFLQIDTQEGAREVVVFANVYKKVAEMLKKGNLVMCNGKKEGEKVLAHSIKELT